MLKSTKNTKWGHFQSVRNSKTIKLGLKISTCPMILSNTLFRKCSRRSHLNWLLIWIWKALVRTSIQMAQSPNKLKDPPKLTMWSKSSPRIASIRSKRRQSRLQWGIKKKENWELWKKLPKRLKTLLPLREHLTSDQNTSSKMFTIIRGITIEEHTYIQTNWKMANPMRQVVVYFKVLWWMRQIIWRKKEKTMTTNIEREIKM